MTKFNEDIIQRIKSDFKDLADTVIAILQESISKTDYLKTERIIRCIIYLAHGDISKLRKYIDNAIFDPRDVMLWAEYENLKADQTPKRIRDFNKTFEKCTDNVKE